MSNQLVLSAGMRRSGSTWLFNVIRLVYALDGQSPSYCFRSRYSRRDTSKPLHVVKAHDFSGRYCREASLVFTSYRDVRDVAASAVRLAGQSNAKRGPMSRLRKALQSGDEGAGDAAVLRLVMAGVQAHQRWAKAAAYDMRYEEMVADPCRVVSEVAAILGVTVGGADCDGVLEGVERLRLLANSGAKNKETGLFKRGHITQTTGSYADTLSQRTIALLEDRFDDWLRLHRYA